MATNQTKERGARRWRKQSEKEDHIEKRDHHDNDGEEEEEDRDDHHDECDDGR